VCEG